MHKIRVAVVVGTRPEAIKMLPIILASQERPDRFQISVVRTGQHGSLVDQLMDEFNIRAPENLQIMQQNQSLHYVLSQSLNGLSRFLEREQPDFVLVQGDTTTTLAGALAGFYSKIAVGHVEAGLRSKDRHSPFPEEVNRSIVARLADVHFAPTELARHNLLHEGIADKDIVVTGNTIVDALLQTLRLSSPRASTKTRYLVVTAHRRENHGAPLVRICDGILALLDRHPDLHAVVSMHPNPAVHDVLVDRLGGRDRIILKEALGYVEFVALLKGASLVLTDSGGIQEECAVLCTPLLILRDVTERPEVLGESNAVLAGTDAAHIADIGTQLLAVPRSAQSSVISLGTEFGDGSASRRILDVIERRFR
jgi:UDP-N-acetylglucosamine 2-epimerase (non-hydrolysing)